MRKIDADALLKTGCEVCREEGRNEECAKECIFYNILQNTPTIEEDTICECNLADNAALICEILNADAEGKEPDLVKVVRCKDCKWFCNMFFPSYCDLFKEAMDKNYYCALGEKKTMTEPVENIDKLEDEDGQ